MDRPNDENGWTMREEMFIGGNWTGSAEGRRLEVIDPATEATIATVPAATAPDVDKAVAAARTAFDSGPWPRLSGAERAATLRRVADLIEARAGDIAEIEMRDNGKPRAEALLDIGDAAHTFRYYADMAETERTETVTPVDPRYVSKVVFEPVGVVAAIVPWNFPFLMSCWKVAPALGAGCTMVLKPSELTPLSALVLAEILAEAGLPEGVFNVITGFGLEAGKPLAAHPGVDKIAFTGSVPTGSALMQQAALDIKRISLELGGKSPFIVFEDADIERAAEWIAYGIFFNQGQVCAATSRVLIHEAIYAPVLDAVAAYARKIVIGSGAADGTQLGPLISAAHREKVEGFIVAGLRDGARLVAGGKRPDHLATGYFLEPTIFADVPVTSTIWTEEIFGPVVAIRAFTSEDEAISLANDSRFGLAAAVMSDDSDRAERVAAALRAGIVWINCSQPAFVEAPWGGFKQSGIGRELGRWGYENFLEPKQITRFAADEPLGWY